MSNNALQYAILSEKQEKNHLDDGLVELLEILEIIDENGSLAKENKVSISDNNGGRILL